MFPNNVSKRYLKKTSLQQALERLFPGHKEFNIRVGCALGMIIYPVFRERYLSGWSVWRDAARVQMKDDQWCFTAPGKVQDADIEYAIAFRYGEGLFLFL
ncbi:hypothetical protein XA68_15177 [Ophiocordyceps unilateralis]|uniref:Uncharacterized protein n=1 Tax=Ophiocordyceps unilateralis TaxID=268505 RepID=A0A2A9PMP6_OPHUN|nr:hypothetical protein XA68_15177 [Ophiocordyceps unilateralis]